MITVIESVAEMREFIAQVRQQGKKVGLVPTMGALHEGHLALMGEAKSSSDIVVASIFVNPTQFGPNEDYDAYPRTWQSDIDACRKIGVDVVFRPPVAEMYPQGWGTWVSVEKITEKLCGQTRPGHFRGVATVVTKLFNIVQPDSAFFGQKDAQQVAVLMKMVRDLNMKIEIIVVPIVRDPDGLAKSSRNIYLTPEQRTAALVLSRSLLSAQQMVLQGQRGCRLICSEVQNKIAEEPLAVVEYVQMYSYPELQEITTVRDKVLLAVAVRFGTTRLIDNIILEVKE